MGVSVAFLTKAWHKTDISQSKSKYLTSKPRSCNANTVFKKKKNELRDRSVNLFIPRTDEVFGWKGCLIVIQFTERKHR